MLTFIVLVDFVLLSSLHVCSLQLLHSVSYFYLSFALSIVEQVCLSCVNKYCASVGIQLFHVLLILIVVSVSTASTSIVPVLTYSGTMCPFSLVSVQCWQCVYSVDQCSASVGIQFLVFLAVVNVDSVSTALTNVVPVLAYSCTMPSFSLNSGQWWCFIYFWVTKLANVCLLRTYSLVGPNTGQWLGIIIR